MYNNIKIGVEDNLNQKRYNLMIVGQEVINKLESLPERHKGMYVSEAIIDKIKKDDNQISGLNKEEFEDYLRRIIREEINKIS
jgi:hypothetical protein